MTGREFRHSWEDLYDAMSAAARPLHSSPSRVAVEGAPTFSAREATDPAGPASTGESVAGPAGTSAGGAS